MKGFFPLKYVVLDINILYMSVSMLKRSLIKFYTYEVSKGNRFHRTQLVKVKYKRRNDIRDKFSSKREKEKETKHQRKPVLGPKRLKVCWIFFQTSD